MLPEEQAIMGPAESQVLPEVDLESGRRFCRRCLQNWGLKGFAKSRLANALGRGFYRRCLENSENVYEGCAER